LLAQSFATTHALPSSQPVQSMPPQSMSVSVPFFTVSTHLGGTQAFITHTPLMQWVDDVHSTHSPVPSQN